MKTKKWIITTLILCFLAVGAIFSYQYFTRDTISPRVCAPEKPFAKGPIRTAAAEKVPVTQWYDAVGTVQPSVQSRIAAQVSGQVTAVHVNAGDTVKKGQGLVNLDDRQLQSRLSQARESLKTAVSRRDQARQAVQAAMAALEEATSAYERVKKFYALQAATEQDLEQVRSRFHQAAAGLEQARDMVHGAAAGIRGAEDMVAEAKIFLGYTEVRAPADGKVLKQMVEPGDFAMPGSPLIMLRTAGGLRLEAHVRESLIRKVQPGAALQVELATLDKTVEAVVEEVIPVADARSRTFLVKASLPDMVGLYPGMYGKLKIPLEQETLVLIPASAVVRVGQLEMVLVQTPEGCLRQYVKTGNRYNGRVEVLSGLSGGETLQVKEPGNDK